MASFNIALINPQLNPKLTPHRIVPIRFARAVDGFEATVVAIKANEAVMKRERITFQKEWFSLT